MKELIFVVWTACSAVMGSVNCVDHVSKFESMQSAQKFATEISTQNSRIHICDVKVIPSKANNLRSESSKCHEYTVYCSYEGEDIEGDPCWVKLPNLINAGLRFCHKHKEHGRLYHGQD